MFPVIGRVVRSNDLVVYHRALAQQQAVCAQVGIDRVEQVGREAVALQQTPEVEDGGLIGQRLQQRQLRKLAQRRNLVQRLFHRRIAVAEPLLHQDRKSTRLNSSH